VEQIFATVSMLCRERGITIVLVEQNAMGALSIADKGIIINLGVIVAQGDAKQLIDDPALRSAYLGY
jgi:branched-chain amino acid transport system ATP-binding protein